MVGHGGGGHGSQEIAMHHSMCLLHDSNLPVEGLLSLVGTQYDAKWSRSSSSRP